MIEPISPTVVAAVKAVAPMAGREARKFRRRNEIRALVRAATTRVARDHRVPAAARKPIEKRIKGLLVDPTALGCLRDLVEEGDLDVLPVLRKRAGELLAQQGDGWNSAPVVEAFMAATQTEVVRAKRDERGAIDLSQRLVRSQLGQMEQRIVDRIDRTARGPDPSETPVVGGRAGSVGIERIGRGSQALYAHSEAGRWLRDLADADATLAGEFEDIRIGGAQAMDRWVRDNNDRLNLASVETLVALGRTMSTLGGASAARQVFEVAAIKDDVDPARQLARAANAAIAAGDQSSHDELLARARALGGAEHPAIVLAEVRASPSASPQDSLRRLAGIQPVGQVEAAVVATTRAQLQIALDEWDAADQSLREAESLDPTNLIVRETRALFRLMHAQVQGRPDEHADPDELRSATNEFLRIRDELLTSGRLDEAGHMLARAAEARLAAGDVDEAQRLVAEDVMRPSEHSGTAGVPLARAALWAGLPTRALQLVGDSDSVDATLVRASAAIHNRDASDPAVQAAVAALDRLVLDEDANVRAEASFVRAIASVERPDIAWSADAERELQQRDPVLTDLMHGAALVVNGDADAAESLYLRHADRPRAMSGLVDVAVLRRDYTSAVQRQEALLRRENTHIERLRHADLLRLDGRTSDALAAFMEVGRDASGTTQDRLTALRMASGLAQQIVDPESLETLCSEWLALDPGDGDAHWLRAWARARRADYSGALQELDTALVEPSDLQQATLLAGLLVPSDDVGHALERLANLSDRFDRPEDLEAAIIVTAQRRHGDLRDDLRARVQRTYADFGERFPDSRQIVVIKIPDDPEALREWLNEIAPDPTVSREAAEQVLTGGAPVAAVAHAAGRQAAFVWAELAPLPLGFSSPTIENLERDDARAALGNPVVVETSAAVMTAGMGEEVRDALLRALPGSIIPEAVLRDLDMAATPVGEAGRIAGTLTRSESGEATLVEADELAADDGRRRLGLALDIGRRLTVRANVDPDTSDELERLLLRPDGESSGPLRALIATLAVARRDQLSVLTDDRWLRIGLRREGIRSFGTPVLLEALLDRSLITPEQFATARLALLTRGARGLHPATEELLRFDSTSSTSLRYLFYLLTDSHWWTNVTAEAVERNVALLHARWEADPGSLRLWTARSIDAARQGLPGAPLDLHVFRVLSMALGVFGGVASPSFVRSLIDALRKLPPDLRGSRDPVELTFDLLMQISATADRTARASVIFRALACLPLKDQEWAFARYVR